LLNERIKEAKKKKNIADTTKKQIVVENLRDIENGDIFLGEEKESNPAFVPEELPDVDPDITPTVITEEIPRLPIDNDPVVSEKQDAPAVNQLVKIDKSYKKDNSVLTENDIAKRKSRNKKIAIIAIIIFLLIVALLFGWIYREKIAEIFHTNNGNTPTYVVDKQKISTVLYKGGAVNENLYNYFEAIKQDVAAKKSGSDISAQYSSKIKTEKATLENMKSEFAAIEGGSNYYNSLIDRYENLIRLANGLTFTASQVDTLNQYIAIDQALLSRSRAALINMLDTNGIKWTEENGQIYWNVEE